MTTLTIIKNSSFKDENDMCLTVDTFMLDPTQSITDQAECLRWVTTKLGGTHDTTISDERLVHYYVEQSLNELMKEDCDSTRTIKNVMVDNAKLAAFQNTKFKHDGHLTALLEQFMFDNNNSIAVRAELIRWVTIKLTHSVDYSDVDYDDEWIVQYYIDRSTEANRTITKH